MTLRITRVDGPPPRVTLKLEGRLVAEWDALLKRECSAVLRWSNQLVLDMSGVSFVDADGVEVLAQLARAGVVIRDCTESIGSVLERQGVRIVRDADSVEPEDRASRHLRRAARPPRS